ncbi:hypothetical protein MOD14_10480 [Bacillus haynesii]|uniref:hypothetical protein n=1 Tax=Bacillus haynesii TaxID=1925021 RepID=UPI0022831A25|nr:hypothetical protein [Bacillus haynesii]MCY8354593.1 hypothetical protein [Bacillus haynesii]MCY8410584.1 hypothetical protein [Bacillus haynesii]MCY8432520.1 hypothetical protein [Bacillus haynesii]MCY8624426.1 hypothetical protein [Bacillus haynesii]MCY8737718.1 hypothetical protein [Bacillus haynesii]
MLETKYLITLLAAILGAFIAQLLSHFLTYCREKKKEEKEVYQKLVAPFLKDVLFYINGETLFRKGHDLEERVDIEKVIEDISQNLKYGDSKLNLALFKYQNSRGIYDASGFHKDSGRLEFLYWYLDFVMNNGLKSLEYDDLESFEFVNYIRKSQIKCGMWYLFCQKIGLEDSSFKIATLFVYSSNPFAFYTVNDISKIIKSGERISEITIFFDQNKEYKVMKIEDIN